MCHWIRDPEQKREGASLPFSPRRNFLSQRPALAAVVAVLLVAMVAVAALVFPSATTAVSATKAASPHWVGPQRWFSVLPRRARRRRSSADSRRSHDNEARPRWTLSRP